MAGADPGIYHGGGGGQVGNGVPRNLPPLENVPGNSPPWVYPALYGIPGSYNPSALSQSGRLSQNTSSYKAKECCRLLGSWVCHVLADFPGRYIPGIKCFRPIRSLVTLKFPAIDNIFHIFFCCQKLRGGGGARPHDFLTRGGGGSAPSAPPPPGSAYEWVLS